ncbi:MAG: 2Fe-2S iron-sulfur cluster-binding protein [Cyanobacteria bacterium J06621_11]
MITIIFPDTNFPQLAADQTEPLSTQLTLQNSPILFGCRTGICGTCLVLATGDIQSPTAEEQEVLDILVPGCATARLACQLKPTGDISLTPLSP